MFIFMRILWSRPISRRRSAAVKRVPSILGWSRNPNRFLRLLYISFFKSGDAIKSGDGINEPFRMSSWMESGMESLLSSLASLERKLKEHGEMDVTDAEANRYVRTVGSTVGVGTNPPAEVAWAAV